MSTPFDLGMIKFKVTFYEVAGEFYLAIHTVTGAVLGCKQFTSDPTLPENRTQVSKFVWETARDFVRDMNMKQSVSIGHPEIALADQTCAACPEQWEGRLITGENFYFRMRHGTAQLGIGHTAIEAIETAFRHRSMQVETPEERGHHRAGRGMFNTPEERLQVFTALLDNIRREVNGNG